MRFGFIIAGVIIAAIGIAAVLGKFEYQKTDTLLQVGDAKLEANHDKAVPQWAGIIALVIGGGLVLVGAVKKS